MDFPRMAREAIESWKRWTPEVVAFDTETTGLDFYDRPFCATLAWRGRDGHLESHYVELGLEPGYDAFVAHVLDTAPILVGHNLKFDLQKALLAGLVQRERLCAMRLEDTEAMAHLLDEHRLKGLKHLTRTVLGEDTDEEAAIKEAKVKVKKDLGLRSEREIGYHMLPRGIVVPYAIKDAEFTLRLWEKLAPQLARWDDVSDLYRMEMELSLVLLDMECAGFAVDLDYATSVTREYGRKILAAKNNIAEITGLPVGVKVKDGEFNPNSPKQVTEWFAEEAGIVLLSTDKPALRAVDHPLAKALLELRHLTKLHGTYLIPLGAETRDGIIHPNFRQHGTKTGRMSSGGAAA